MFQRGQWIREALMDAFRDVPVSDRHVTKKKRDQGADGLGIIEDSSWLSCLRLADGGDSNSSDRAALHLRVCDTADRGEQGSSPFR